MSTPLIDLSYLQALSGNDSNYMFDVLNLFMDTVAEGLGNLKHLIRNTGDYEAIRKQAHSLKSATSIIQVSDMYNDVKEIEMLAVQRAALPQMEERLNRMFANFNEALPHLQEERDRNKPKTDRI